MLPGEWHKAEGITTLTTGDGYLRISEPGHTFVPNEYMIELTEPVLIDLTEVFDTGNEPTSSWCSAIINFFTGQKEFSIKDYLKAKILCFGDSNTANGIYGYTNKLDINAVNGGWGSACMAYKTGTTQSTYRSNFGLKEPPMYIVIFKLIFMGTRFAFCNFLFRRNRFYTTFDLSSIF